MPSPSSTKKDSKLEPLLVSSVFFFFAFLILISGSGNLVFRSVCCAAMSRRMARGSNTTMIITITVLTALSINDGSSLE